MSEPEPSGGHGGLERLSSTRSVLSMSSLSSDMLVTMSTANCEMALLPLKLLLELQSPYLTMEDDTLTSINHNGGYNIISDESVHINGRPCRISNYIERNVTLKSHYDYKDYRETILAKPMLFITNAKKINSDAVNTFAFIVNTRHPKMKAQIEGAMNDVISSVMGENYQLQFDFQNVVRDHLLKERFELPDKSLSFLYTFKADVFIDLFYLLGLSKKTCNVNGIVLNLNCTTPAKKEKVKRFLSNMSNLLIRMGSSADRRFSAFSLDVISEDPFPPPEGHHEEFSQEIPLTP
ncbi:mesenteric estrogen-dependent adipogenesis protein [Spea bombifrons]|uniref:mesenteric estrogen-dependent adipogenesis protein n=1 Tax=Spea bombifrons TaxID=233779 RepID=UPI00234BF3AF|nr:mesenteric estrogen-dependent adipogenesis protein [Spea bombifrons]